MSRIIHIETSTALCSTALSEDGRIVAYRQSSEPRSQASMTAVYIDGMLAEKGWKASDCDAVCVSKGPGSYTGLRVGSSSAKGLCFGADLPLIAVSTLETLVCQAQDEGLVPDGCTRIVPMVDARRMEVYTAVFDASGKALTDVSAMVIDSGSFDDLRGEKILFIGDGTGKCSEALSGLDATFVQCYPKASALLRPAEKALNEKRFEDTAYFEPFYLKDFVATVSRKKLF